MFDGPPRLSKSAWLSHYPACNTASRTVAADFTPYLYCADAPKKIAKYYGHLKSRLKFTILLRDPVTRILSAFYNWQRAGWNSACTQNSANPFKTYVDKLLDAGAEPCSSFWGPFSGSLYNKHLQAWFGEFNPKQFTIVPMQYVTQNSSSTMNSAWETLGVDGCYGKDCLKERCMMGQHLGNKCNTGNRPAITEVLDSTTLDRLRVFVDSHVSAAAIAKTLAQANGVSMFGHVGRRDDPHSIEYWLSEMW